MTDDPITAALAQLADHHEQLTQLTDLVTGIGDTLREHAAALAKLAEPAPAEVGPDGYNPGPPPAWWKLAAAERQEPTARLRAWVEQVYHPGYGHIAATLAPPAWSPATRGAGHDRRHFRPGPGLCPPRLAGVSVPARPEDPRHRARLPGRHHRRAADHGLVRPRVWLEPGHRHWRARSRRPGRRPARPGREWLRRLRPASPRRPGRRRRRLRADPGRRDARLLHRHRPAQRPSAPPPPRFPLHRRLRPGPGLPDRRHALPAHQPAPRARQPGLGRGHPAARTAA